MADKLISVVLNVTGTTPSKVKALTVPAPNFDKCVVTSIVVANKGTTQDQVYITLVRGGTTVSIVPGQPIGAYDAWCSKGEMSLHLHALDEIWIEGKNAGQNLDVIINYLLSDIL